MVPSRSKEISRSTSISHKLTGLREQAWFINHNISCVSGCSLFYKLKMMYGVQEVAYVSEDMWKLAGRHGKRVVIF